MERMKKVAQEKKKWKDKASFGEGSNGPASGVPALSKRMGTALHSVQGGGHEQGVAISQYVQGRGVQKAPVTVDRVLQQAVISNVALPSCSTASSASNISSSIGGASLSSSSGGHSSNHQSSLAARPAPTICGGSISTKPASVFYKPQASQPPLPRGNFRSQEQPSAFKHQPPSKV